MSDTFDYDIAVIGAGPAGYVAAIRAAQLGAQVCIIEKGALGGTCTNIGCIPTKAMRHSAHVLLTALEGAKFGVNAGGAVLDFAAAAAHRDGVIAKLTGGIKGLLKGNKVDLIVGAASFEDAHTLAVASGDETPRLVTAEKVFIATGSVPIDLPMAKFDHEHILDSGDMLTATTLPESLIIVGGGYIGIEFAGIYAACGVPVTVVEALDDILPGSDPDCAKIVRKNLKKRKVKLLTGAALESVEVAADGVTAKLAGDKEVSAAAMLVCVGRRADCTGLAAENAGLEVGDRGELAVDEHMQTTVPHIYAIGDVTGGPLLAHVGSQEGLVAAAHAMGSITAKMDYAVVPACVFSFPELASVGMTEERAAEVVGDIVVKKFPFVALGKAHIQGATDGLVKLIACAATGKLLGAHICGEDASTMLAEATLALQLECTAEELAHTIHAHPTMAEALSEAAEGVIGQPINWKG
jgi:dihydrolipoyl dehydrogenase